VGTQNNKIGGTLPDSFASLAQLRILDLSANQLSGVLPHAWSDMASLGVLDLRQNRLQGALRCSWAGMQSLRLMRLSDNTLIGQLCPEFGQISSLEVIDLSMPRHTINCRPSGYGKQSLTVCTVKVSTVNVMLFLFCRAITSTGVIAVLLLITAITITINGITNNYCNYYHWHVIAVKGQVVSPGLTPPD
jgi:hypothetical protein